MLPRSLSFLAPATLIALSAVSHFSPSQQDDALQELAGDWLYVRDLTAGRASEDQGPPMSVKFALRVEQDAVVFVRGNGREERITLDGSVIQVPGETSTHHYSGKWMNDALHYTTKIVRNDNGAVTLVIQRTFEMTDAGLQIRVQVDDPPTRDSLALYQHPQDIPMPEAAEATIDQLSWLAGNWVGTRGSSSIEERWGPPLGGAMLGTSRTVRRERMVGFEFLRVVERDGSLVYLAQPGGRAATEFVLTELDGRRAVFANPRHSSPQRIVYELADEGALSATIGFMNGGRGTRFEFTREDA